MKHYEQCQKCGIIRDYSTLNRIWITNETLVYWCDDCLQKHLNSKGVTK